MSALIASFVEATPPDLPLLVAVDQEGGRVARLGPPVLKLPPMRELAALDDANLTERAGRLLGRQLKALGFTMDCAPVLDVDTNPQNPVIGDRSFGGSAELVVRQAFAFARGLEQGGVLTCGKHFPGHGDTDLDSHFALPRLRHERARLNAVELAPFRAARGKLDAIMTAHVVYDALAQDLPATLSRALVTELLRGELGFEGPVISDDLEMKAVADQFGIERSACMAIEAGCDVLLVCSRVDWFARAHAALVARADQEPAFRRRLHDAAERALAMRARRPPAPIGDPALLSAALDAEETAALEREIAQRSTASGR